VPFVPIVGLLGSVGGVHVVEVQLAVTMVKEYGLVQFPQFEDCTVGELKTILESVEVLFAFKINL